MHRFEREYGPVASACISFLLQWMPEGGAGFVVDNFNCVGPILVAVIGPPKRPRIPANGHVCFTPESGHMRCNWGCPLWARSGLMHRSKNYSYSITSSARASSVGGIESPSASAV
jgi:hypothetical protein